MNIAFEYILTLVMLTKFKKKIEYTLPTTNFILY